MDMLKVAKVEGLISEIDSLDWLPYEEYPRYNQSMIKLLKGLIGEALMVKMEYTLPDVGWLIKNNLVKVPMKLKGVKIDDSKMINELVLNGDLSAGNMAPKPNGRVSVPFEGEDLSLIAYMVREKGNQPRLIHKVVVKSKMGFELQLFYLRNS